MTKGNQMLNETGRPFCENTLVSQIGMMNVLSISGGRVKAIENKGETVEVILPVSNGYQVSIKLGWNDLYTVSRQYVRKGVVLDKGTVTDIFCDSIGEIVYQASCFRNVKFGEE
jgi:hypothetical protein